MKEILRLSLPMTVWVIGFCAVYALHGLSCARHWPASLDPRSVLIAAACAAIAVQTTVMIGILRYPLASRSLQHVAAVIAATGVVASVWTLAPAIFATVCV